ncbi:MAG: HEAT repeat domain-containing protein [Candidatus Omnitrophica bacterium]|nr:HEAT repeat domain-containing protein [Candidatus Omnitrophota bacterium]MCM8802492.1 HEAT repeat domain-containing protein [Candidatus Omnitrophota bacterium]
MKKLFLFLFISVSLLFSQEMPKELKIEIENLNSDNVLKRVYAAYKIRNLKYDIKETVPYLLNILDDERVVIDKVLGKTSPSDEAKKTLIKIGSSALPYIFEKFNDEKTPKSLKIKIIEIFREINDENAMIFLEKIANEKDYDLKEKAIEILSLNKNETDFLIDYFKTTDNNLKIKIISGFGKTKNSKAIPFLYELLNDKNWEIRKYTLWAIGEIKESVDIEKLIPLVKDKNEFVRKELAETFRKIKNNSTIPHLIELINDSNWMVKVTGIKAASEFKDPRFFEIILSNLYDKQIEVKLEAIKALAVFKDQRATISLISNLNDRYHLLVREYSAYALGEMRDKRAIYSLINLLKSENYELRKIVRDSLRKITGIDFGYDKEKWYNWAGQNRISSIREN